VNQPGFGIHLDAAAMTLSADSPAEVFRAALPWWRHFHVSEPYLGLVGQGGMDHGPLAATLRETGYANWLSIEMKVPASGFDPAQVERAIALVQDVYRSGT